MPVTIQELPNYFDRYLSTQKGTNELQKQRIENQYLPMKTSAQAMSQLAYANLLGPQFMAKMLGNNGIVANMTPEQRRNALQFTTNAGMNPTGRNIFNPDSSDSSTGGSLIGNIFNLVRRLHGNRNNQLNQQQPFQTVPQQQTQVPIKNTSNSGGSGAIMNDTGSVPSLPLRNTPNPDISFDTSGKPVLKPLDNNVQNNNQNNDQTYFENEGEAQGIVEQKKEAGKNRANDVKNFGDQYETGLSMNDKYKTLTDLVNSPEFRTMRENIPFFQDKQLSVLSSLGTPQQKEMVGKFRTSTNEIMGDIIRSFGAQKFKGESDIAQNMKINDKDPFGVIVGKLQASMLYKNLNMERIRIASDLMEEKHLSKRKALEMADKQIDGDAIRKNIATKLDYPVQVRRKRNDGTYEIETVPVSVARKRGIKDV